MSPSGGHSSQHRVTEHTKPLTCARKAGTRPLAPGAALPRPRSPAGRMGVAWRPPCRSGRSVHPQGPSPVPGGRDEGLAGALRVDLCPLQKVFSVHVSHTHQIAPNPRAKPPPPSTRTHAHAHPHTRMRTRARTARRATAPPGWRLSAADPIAAAEGTAGRVRTRSPRRGSLSLRLRGVFGAASH